MSDYADQAQACEESVPAGQGAAAPPKRICLHCGDPIGEIALGEEPDRLVCEPCEGAV